MLRIFNITYKKFHYDHTYIKQLSGVPYNDEAEVYLKFMYCSRIL